MWRNHFGDRNIKSRFSPSNYPTAWVPQWPWNDFTFGPWIGAFQLPGSAEPASGWTWITGVPFQPDPDWMNNSACGLPEEKLHLYYSTEGIVGMNDMPTGPIPAGCGPGNPSYLIEWSADCNGDGIVDYGQILDGTFEDANENGIPDCCDDGESCTPCPGDVNDSGIVNATDIAIILGAWGTSGGKFPVSAPPTPS
jgi:hypothetical protein